MIQFLLETMLDNKHQSQQSECKPTLTI